MTTILPLNLLVNFRSYKYEIDYYLKDADSYIKEDEYKILTNREQVDNAQLFINQICQECNAVQYSSDLENMISEFNTFYTTYRDDIPNDYMSLQSFVCMVSNILNLLSDNTLNYFLNYDFSYRKILDIADSSVSTQQKIINYRSLRSDIFLAKTIFSQKSNIKYIAKGVNGGVDIISINDGTNKFNVIEKYMLPKSSGDELSELLELLRELIVSSQLLFNVRQFTPNFTTIYGMYVAHDSVPYNMNDAIVDTYISAMRGTQLGGVLDFLKNTNIYTKQDESGYEERVFGNLDETSKKVYLLTEYAPGKTFGEYIKSIIIANDIGSAPNVIGILLQIFRSLIFAYNKIGYRHNDLHYGNVMVNTLNTNINVPEIIIPESSSFGHTSQDITHLAQIIDYGYSSINDYVKYFYSIFSDRTTTVHSDIIRLYTSLMKLLYYMDKDSYGNETLYTILKYLTLTVGSYYFSDHTRYKITDDAFSFGDILVEYEKSGLVDEFEAITFDNNELLNKTGYNTGINFYEYMIQQINNMPDYERDIIGLSVVSDDQLYDTVGLLQRATYVPVIDNNNELILNNELPLAFTDADYDTLFDIFIDLCAQITVIDTKISDETQRAELFVFLYLAIYTMSKYVGVYTLSALYGRDRTYSSPDKVVSAYEYMDLIGGTIATVADEIWDSKTLDNRDIIEKVRILKNIGLYFSK